MWPKMAYSDLSKPTQNLNFNFKGLELILVVARLCVCMILNDTKKLKHVVYEIVIIDLVILLLKIR